MVLSHGFITFVLITILSFSVLGMETLKKTGIRSILKDLEAKPVIFINPKKVLSPIKSCWGKDKSRESSKESLFDQYSSFYEAARFFEKNQSQKDSGLEPLAIHVSGLLDKPKLYSRSLKSLLQSKRELAGACEIWAIHALRTPEKLNSFERIWVVGILAGLATGNQDLKIPKDLSRHVYLEIQAALHYEPQMTKTFEHWIPGKKVGLQIFGSRLEEILNRADIIGKYESKRPPILNTHPIDDLVSQLLLKVELPEDKNRISDIMGQLRQIFKTMEYDSWEGRYTRDIFEHMSFYSNQFKELIRAALEDGGFWRDLHISLAKNDVIELSNKLQPILQSFHVGIGHSLYEILKTPSSDRKYFQEAISNLLGKLNVISSESSENLIDAYNLLMAHSFLSRSAEETILTRIRGDDNAHSGISKALAAVYPDFVIDEVNVMDYRYVMWKKEPQFLLGAKFAKRQFDVSKLKKKKSGLRDHFLLPTSILYKLPENYMDHLYIRVYNILKNHEEVPDRSFGIGLETLFILNELYPEKETYLLEYLNRNVQVNLSFRRSILKAIDCLTEKDKFAWRGEKNKLSNDVKNFAVNLKKRVQTQIPQGNTEDVILPSMKERADAKRLSLQPVKKPLKIIIGEEEFDFNPQNWDSFRAPRSAQN